MKAGRDRYLQKAYAGMPYLGSVNSEDALTWNVFRSLQEARCLDSVAVWLRVPLGKAQAMLTWGLTPQASDSGGELQYRLGDLIRRTDGKLAGKTSEPDIVILGTESIVVVECKLGEPTKPLAHLWEGSDPSRVKKRLDTYLEDGPSLVRSRDERDVMTIYQLVRMAYFAIVLGQRYGLRPALVSVANSRNWDLKIRKWQKSPAEMWEDFLGLIQNDDLLCCSTTWQASVPLVHDQGILELHRYLEEHPCL